jgi:hypothetical protein
MGAAVEAAMLEAHRAGLSVIPLRENKRPAIAWGDRTDSQPDELTVRREARSCDGFAIACGGPTRLQVLDFEQGFVSGLGGFSALLVSLDLATVFESWLNGYFVATPGGGFHVGVHVGGDGTPPGNTKLAMTSEGQTLVETRGHGGYVVAAPSNGRTHPNGGVWEQQRGSFDSIAWATPEEWNAICSAIATYDAGASASVVAETPPEPAHSPVPGGVSLAQIERSSEWIDDAGKPSMSAVLENNGWTYSHADRKGTTYWARPDKPVDEGHSATVNPNDRLCVFSENAHPVPVSRNNYTESFDSIDVMGCYQLGRLPTQDERTEILRQLAGRDRPRTRGGVALEPTGWLSNDFWESREYLAAIRRAAWEAQRGPESFLGSVLSTYAVTVPCSITLEALVGGNESPLNTFVALVGPPGAGKSGAIAAARKMCDTDSMDKTYYRFGQALRSGEGLIAAVRIPQPKNTGAAALGLHRNGVQVVFDEGSSLASQNDRSGSTVLSSLCTAWSGLPGSTIGGALAAGEDSFAADAVRIGLILGIQYGIGGALFTKQAAAQGFPARLLYFGMDNLGDRSLRRKGSAPNLHLPRYYPDANRPILMTFPASVEEEVSVWDERRQMHGVDPLDGHQMLLRMRVAGLLALMDQSAQVDPVHWELAGELEKHSRATRARVLAGLAEVTAQAAKAAGRNDAVRESAHHDATIEDRAERLARWLQGVEGTAVPWRQVRDRFNGDDRKQIESIVAYAVERNWVEIVPQEGKRFLRAGQRRPTR